MKNEKTVVILVSVCILASVMALSFAAMANDAPRITKEELKELLGKPDLVIIDVRSSPDWDGSDSKIQGAVREDPRKVGQWAEKYPKDKTLVFYCS